MTEEKTKETAIVQRREDTLVPDAKNMSDLSKILLDSGMWPNLKSKGVPGVFAVIEYGRELGIPPVAALNTMAIVNGRLTMEAKAMLAIAVQRAGVTWKVKTLTAKGCILIFSRPGFDAIEVGFDESDAKAAGLLGKDNWQNYAKDMYFARAASRGIRQIAPDAVLGLYAVEEMQDIIMPAVGEVTEAKPEAVKVAQVAEPEPEKKEEQKKGPGRPRKETEAKPKEEATNPTPEPAELDKLKGEIILTLRVLVEKFGRDPGDLLERIKGRVKSVFSVERERIPEDLEEKEAIVVRNALRNSIEAEEAEAAKEKEL